jgi:hypothetical protein
MIDRKTALGHRLAVNGLAGRRLPHTRLREAARPGLQDGSPRSGLLSLAARVTDVGPDDWRDPDLAQVFGPRGAIYLVRRRDIGIFTKGLLPRDAHRIQELERHRQRVHDVLADGPKRQTDLIAALPGLGGSRVMRWAATLGTIVPVWDTVDTIIHSIAEPQIEAEEARDELGRRFFSFLGPATVGDLQWWLDGSRADAEATAAAIAGDLQEVTIEGRSLLLTAPPTWTEPDPDAVHLLPPDDPYINRRTRDILLPHPATRKLLWPKAPPPGALVIGGEVAGTWRRRSRRVEITQWRPVTIRHRTIAEQIVAQWPLEGTESTVAWIHLA